MSDFAVGPFTRNELIVRALAAAIVVIFTISRRRYSKRWKSTHADAPTRRVDTREKLLLGGTMFVGRGIGFVWLVTPWLDRWSLDLPLAIRSLGIALAAAGIALLSWVHKTLGDNWSPSLEIRRDHELIQNGPYAVLRHPMYTAIGAVLFGYAILSGNAVVLLITPIPFSLLVASRLGTEERMMLEQFGDRYRDYARRTKRLVPFVF